MGVGVSVDVGVGGGGGGWMGCIYTCIRGHSGTCHVTGKDVALHYLSPLFWS